MPRGQDRVNNRYDASALLNLISFCNYFHSVDVACVKEVNVLLDSDEFGTLSCVQPESFQEQMDKYVSREIPDLLYVHLIEQESLIL